MSQPAPMVEPDADDDLALAGRDGVPGWLYCSNAGPFSFDALRNPSDAAYRVGPEYDLLRKSLPLFWLPSEHGPQSVVREVVRTATTVSFLADRDDERDREPQPYSYVDLIRDQVGWRWAGSGDCKPRAWAPPGYGTATWELDPAFRKPGARTETLHLLVHEIACSSGQDAHGRIGPAYVILDQYVIYIELLVRYLPGHQDCPGVAPTPARLQLHEALGDRPLEDINAHILNGAGG